jgi:5,10-methylenetetrahydromethanopterin reductase
MAGTNSVTAPRISFSFIPGPAQETTDVVRLGEELGFDGVWIPDQGFHRDPFVLLALCAKATQRITLGLGLTSPFTRLPVQIARGVGSVDEIADGRMRLALGTGNVAHVVRPLGVPFEHPVARLRDAIHIVRRLLAGESVDFDGAHDQLRGVRLDFRTRADVPIYIGTRGQKTLGLAGECADGVLAESLFNAGGADYVMKSIMTGAAIASRPLHNIDVVAWQVVVITDRVDDVVNALRPWAARTIQHGPLQAMHAIGIEDVHRKVTNAIAVGDRAAAIAAVSDKAIHALMVVGPVNHVRERLAWSLAHGATSINVLSTGGLVELSDNLRRFAREIMPELAAVNHPLPDQFRGMPTA